MWPGNLKSETGNWKWVPWSCKKGRVKLESGGPGSLKSGKFYTGGIIWWALASIRARDAMQEQIGHWKTPYMEGTKMQKRAKSGVMFHICVYSRWKSYVKFAGPTAHRRVRSPEYNPRSFCWFVDTPRPVCAILADWLWRGFRPLGAPGPVFFDMFNEMFIDFGWN